MKDDADENQRTEFNAKVTQSQVIHTLMEHIAQIERDFNQFKADLSKVLFQITERLTRLEDTTKSYMLNLNDLYFKQEKKIELLDQERLFLEGRIVALEISDLENSNLIAKMLNGKNDTDPEKEL